MIQLSIYLPVMFHKLNSDIAALIDWFRANKLSLNVGKTNFMIVKANNTINLNQTININNNQVQQVTHVKFLGLFLDENLNWHEQINHCKNKVASGLYALNASKHITKKSLEDSLLLSY